MANAFFSFEPLESSGYQNQYGFAQEGMSKEVPMFEPEDLADEMVVQSRYQYETYSDFGASGEAVYSPIQSSLGSSLFESILQEISSLVDTKKDRPYQIPEGSLKLLRNYRSGLKSSSEDKLVDPDISGRRLSTEEVMRVAGARYIQLYVDTEDDLSVLGHPFGCALLGLNDEEIKDVELVHILLAAAEKVGFKQFERASRLLSQCYLLASSDGNPVQRVVYYFAEALQERIDRETGRTLGKGFGKGNADLEIEEAMMSLHPAIWGYHQRLPFSQMLQVAVTQTIIDNVGSAKRVHLIDLCVRTGMQWTVLMHALALRRDFPVVEHLKITAIGTVSEENIKETGRRLSGFADTMSLPFSFNVVMVPDMKDLKVELLEIQTEESLVVSSPMVLRTMIAQPDHLENLMKVIKSTNPCVMVVTEMEANHNSPIFVNRFLEALFFYSAFFDSFDSCTNRDDGNREMMEKIFASMTIRNIVSTEGTERTMRHVGIDVWRDFFSQFEMVEIELSESSLYQAKLVLGKFACADSCTLDMNGKCLTIGWKGTPFHSFSAWKFNQPENGHNQ